MPAKKTFHSIRVRGFAHFDQVPQHQGVPVSVHREFTAGLQLEEGGDLSVAEFINTLGGPVSWERFAVGDFRGTLEGDAVACFGHILPQSGCIYDFMSTSHVLFWELAQFTENVMRFWILDTVTGEPCDYNDTIIVRMLVLG